MRIENYSYQYDTSTIRVQYRYNTSLLQFYNF